MGASSKQDRLKDVKVKHPDKGAVGRLVRTEVDLSDVIPPGVFDQSSSTIYRSRRKPSATGAVVSGIRKAEWKLEGLHKARKPNRGDSLLRTPMDAEDYYVDDVIEEEREDVSESDGVWESDSSASRVACQASIKGSSSNVMDEVTKDLPPIIHEYSIPSGNTANLSKNWEIPKDAVVISSPNSDLNQVKSHMNNDVMDKDGEGYTMVTEKAGNARTATVKGYTTGDIHPNISGSKGSNWNGGNNKRGSYNTDKQGHNGKESVDFGKKEEKVEKGKGLKGSQKENNFGSCRTSFHPVCAREAKHIMEIWGKFGCDDVELRAFCLKHSGRQKDHSPHLENLSVGVEDVKVNDYSNFTQLLKKFIERGKVNLKDVASEINVSANLLASNLADDSLPPDLHGRIVKWLKSHAHVGGLQKNLKLKLVSPCISKAEKEFVALENNVGNSPVKSAPHRRRTKGNIRVLKDNSLILSLKRISGDDGVVMDGDKNGGLEESSPDSMEKISAESCPASDLLVNNSDSGQTEAIESKCDTRVNSNLGNHDCLNPMNDIPDTIRTEALHDSYVHPLILLQNQVLSKINADKEDTLSCISQNQNSPSTESSCDIEKTKLINMSPIDELEGELVYYQHHLLCNAVSRKHLGDDLVSKVIKGRKERRHKEAQVVIAAAAASSRLSSFRKDTLEESAHHENKVKIKAFGGRSAVHAQPKETHPKLSVTWTPPEMNIDSSPSSLDYKGHSRVCDVCTREETILNPVIICSSCKKQGVPSFSYSAKLSRVVECCLCGGTTGAFRKSTDGQWIHAFCAEWVLESRFRRGQLKPIQGMETISRGNDVCLVCSRKVGACIKCNYGHCQSTFHPTCGKSAGFFMNVRTSGGKIQHKAYCEKHSQVERTKAETQKHGVEEWNSLKKVRVELERLRLICERIIRREKLKRELVICSHNMLHWNGESICSSSSSCTISPRGVCTSFVSPNVSIESATTSLRGGYTNNYKSCSETIIQRSDDRAWTPNSFLYR
ncbi:unnamed protein product [Lactuca virosa]|uniref:PHD-type domain-containing protein n=1 Tax=Lactuca virosa TaxID=75947 RepID=A0AAU9LT50_9ASTR|nr:unnamed protein product [Lactuca virosa]